MTKDSNYRTKVKGYKNAIGYDAAYPAYPLNPPLVSHATNKGYLLTHLLHRRSSQLHCAPKQLIKRLDRKINALDFVFLPTFRPLWYAASSKNLQLAYAYHWSTGQHELYDTFMPGF